MSNSRLVAARRYLNAHVGTRSNWQAFHTVVQYFQSLHLRWRNGFVANVIRETWHPSVTIMISTKFLWSEKGIEFPSIGSTTPSNGIRLC